MVIPQGTTADADAGGRRSPTRRPGNENLHAVGRTMAVAGRMPATVLLAVVTSAMLQQPPPADSADGRQAYPCRWYGHQQQPHPALSQQHGSWQPPTCRCQRCSSVNITSGLAATTAQDAPPPIALPPPPLALWSAGRRVGHLTGQEARETKVSGEVDGGSVKFSPFSPRASGGSIHVFPTGSSETEQLPAVRYLSLARALLVHHVVSAGSEKLLFSLVRITPRSQPARTVPSHRPRAASNPRNGRSSPSLLD